MNSELTLPTSVSHQDRVQRQLSGKEIFKTSKFRKYRLIVASAFFGLSLFASGYNSALAQEKPPLVISGSPIPSPDAEKLLQNSQISKLGSSSVTSLVRPSQENVRTAEEKKYDLSQYHSPLEGAWQITQGPSVRTINGEVCGTDDHVSHHNLARYSIDILTPSGIPVRATQEGKVIHAGWINQYGDAVKIQHPDRLVSWYGHLSQINVSVGDLVKAGILLGA